MGNFLDNATTAGAAANPYLLGIKVISGLFGKKRGPSSAERTAAAAQANDLQQKVQMQQLLQGLLPSQFSQAGYNYTPGTAGVQGAARAPMQLGKFTLPGTPGTMGQAATLPSITEQQFQPLKSPDYANAYAASTGTIEANRQRQLIAAAANSNIFARQYNTQQINTGVAQQEAGFNRNWYESERARRDQARANLHNLISSGASGVQGSAQALAGYGQQANAYGAANDAAQGQAISQAFADYFLSHSHAKGSELPPAPGTGSSNRTGYNPSNVFQGSG